MLAEVSVKPAYLHIPPYVATLGDEVGGMCADAGYGPDADQQTALDAIFGRDERGKSTAFETWLIACRQNLKTGTMKMTVLGWSFLLAEDPIMWTAHEWDPAVKEAFIDLENLIQGDSWLRRRVRYVHQADKVIGLVNGSRIMFKVRSPGGGRALAGAKTVLDEGWAIKKAHMGALVPTMSARSMTGDPQILGGSSAAREASEVLHGVVKRGRAAALHPGTTRERKLAYIEYCAPGPEVVCDLGRDCSHELDTPGCGCDKPEVITLANPAIGRRIDLGFVMDSERRSMPPSEFGRERLGWHDIPAADAKTITVEDWLTLADEASEPVGPVALSVVYSNDKRRAAVGLAGVRPDGLWHLELADIVPVAEVVARVGQIIAKAEDTARPVCAVAVDPLGFEGECVQGLLDLREIQLGEDAVPVRIMPAKFKDPPWSAGHAPRLLRMAGPDVTAAFTGFYIGVTEAGNLRHRGQREITTALDRAASRPVGDAGEAWGRRRSGTDISTVVAVTNARWAHEHLAPVMDTEPGAWAI